MTTKTSKAVATTNTDEQITEAYLHGAIHRQRIANATSGVRDYVKGLFNVSGEPTTYPDRRAELAAKLAALQGK